MTDLKPDKNLVELKYKELKDDAENSGYHLNPDEQFVKDLVSGLLTNKNRYGFESCPCRLKIGNKEDNLDIICPCDYRDADLSEYGCCYCAMYVSEEIIKNKKAIGPIPERRYLKTDDSGINSTSRNIPGGFNLKYPIFRCKVCGYLCARENPPEKCPICKADSDRFEKYL